MQNRNYERKTSTDGYTMFDKSPLHKLYHINSELNSTNTYTFIRNIDIKINNIDFIKKVENQYIKYSENKIIDLPKPIKSNVSKDLLTILKNRRTIRNFTGEAIDINQLSNILYYSCGVTGESSKFKKLPEMKLFTYPNAGSIYSIYTYISVKNVNGLDSGIYYYDPILHSLRELKTFIDEKDYFKYSMQYDLLVNSSFTLYLIGSLDVLGLKYGDRAYRFMNLNAGHMAQNFLLTSENYDLGAVASGGFLDLEIRKDFNLDEEFVLYEIVLGIPNLNIEDNRYI